MKSLSPKSNPKIIVIVGPTATGKSDLAVGVAKKFNGEIISADSRQVYKGMDIGSGKITAKEMRGIPHHMLDIVSPNTKYNVVKFQKAARKALAEIIARGKLPIIVGGTGFWVDAVVSNQEFPKAGPNLALRKKLAGWPAAKLFAKLQKLDPRRAAILPDPQNPVRIIRAIEIATAEKTRNKKREVRNISTPVEYSTLSIGLDMPDEKLRANIAKRLKKRLQSGMANETLALYVNGTSWKRLESFGLEYRAMAHMLRDGISMKETEERLNFDIWHYAKRQRSWFKRNKSIKWLHSGDKKINFLTASNYISSFLASVRKS